MAIGSEVFGSYVEDKDVSVSMENRSFWLCCGWNYLGYFREAKRLKLGSGGGGWCQVSDTVLGALGVIEEIKSPCGYRGLAE